MLVFSNAITKVREKAYEALSSRFNITILEDRPYAMIAWPSFFFTIIAQCDALMEPIPAWQRLDKCETPASGGSQVDQCRRCLARSTTVASVAR